MVKDANTGTGRDDGVVHDGSIATADTMTARESIATGTTVAAAAISSATDGSSRAVPRAPATASDPPSREEGPVADPGRTQVARGDDGIGTSIFGPVSPQSITDSESGHDLPVRDPKRYEISGEHARGGLGRILVARDRELHRAVAVKELLKGGPTAQARFVREAMVTIRLEHPAIVPVHEAGRWPSGEPFYAMKMVSGRSLGEVIKDTRTLEERVALLPSVIAVAEAIAYAHSEGVIHRDLKPSNVMVGAYGETLVIDWGLAKDLNRPDQADLVAGPYRTADAEGGLTVAGDVLGTPAYMPPEQAKGDPVDQRADVYALGAMLYHVLSGEPPYLASSSREVLSAVLTGPPSPIEERVPGVPVDLAAIVHQATARDPAQRYPSAKELAEDLRRFQAGRLVRAHDYSPWHLVTRWVRRHRGVVAMAGVAALALAAVGGISVQRIRTQRDVAEAQRRLAKQNRDEVESLLDFMLVDLKEKLKPIGQVPLLDLVARRASAYYENRPIDWAAPEEVRKRAIVEANLGDVLYAQGDLPGALDAHRASLAIRERLVASDPSNAVWQRDLSDSHKVLGDVFDDRGDLPGALDSHRAALAILERLVARDPNNADAQRALSGRHIKVGDVLVRQSDLPAALASYRAGLAIAERLAANAPSDSDRQRDLSVSQNKVGDALVSQGDLPGALAEYRASLTIRERLAASDSTRTDWQRDLSVAHNKVGDVLASQIDLPGALAEYRAGLAIAERLAASDPTNTDWQRDLAISHNKVGNGLRAQGDPLGALAEYRASLAIRERLTASDPSNALWQRDRSVSSSVIGGILYDQGDLPGALAEYRTSLTIRERLASSDPSNAGWQRDLSLSHNRVGTVLLAQRDLPGGLAEWRASLAITERLAMGDPTNAIWQRDVAVGSQGIGDVLLSQGEASAALDSYRTSLAVAERLAASDPADIGRQQDLYICQFKVGEALRASKDVRGACQSYGEALAVIQRLLADQPKVPRHVSDREEIRERMKGCRASDD